MVNHVRQGLWVGGPVLAIYWLAVFTATHWPYHENEPPPLIRIWDKAAHFVAYAGLGLILACVLPGGKRPWLGKYVAALAVLAIYGALDEWSQAFVGRDPDVYDWLADMAGASCGLVLHRIVMWGILPNRPPQESQ